MKCSLYHHTQAWLNTDAFPQSWEFLVPGLWPPNHYHHWALLHRSSHPTQPALSNWVSIYHWKPLYAKMQHCSINQVLSKNFSWERPLSKTNSNNWQYRTKDSAKVEFQRRREKLAPQESSQTQCWWVLRCDDVFKSITQSQTFPFTSELEIKNKGTDWCHILHKSV